MNATAYFISDRAQSLAYEALQFPETAEMAIAWFLRAMAWAKGKGLTGLEETLTAHFFYIGANLCGMNRAA